MRREELARSSAALNGTPVHPLRLVAELQKMLKPDTTLCLDMGSFHLWMARHPYSFRARQILITNGQQTRGRAPDEYADVLRFLARGHRLALVSDIWSKKRLYVEELERVGVMDVFDVTIFSSDGSDIKPSRNLFDRAIHLLQVDRAEAVMIGDSLRRDVGGASAAGSSRFG